MRPRRLLGHLALFLACASLCAGSAAAQNAVNGGATILQQEIKEYEQRLSTARNAHNQAQIASALNYLGSLYRMAGDEQKAMADCNEALGLEKVPVNQALTQNIIARIYLDVGEEQKSIDLSNQILPTLRQGGNKDGEARALFNLGRAYNHMGLQDKALDNYNQALPIFRTDANREGQAETLDGIGRAYSDESQEDKALDFLNQAMPIWRAIDSQSGNGRQGEAMTENNIGKAYADLGKKEEALDFYNRSLTLWQQIGNAQGEGLVLDNLGRLYSDLNQKQKALEIYNQALAIYRAVGSRNGEALELNDIGLVYSDLGDLPRALDSYNQALPLWQAAMNRRGEALTLTHLGRISGALGRNDEALRFFNASLLAWHEVNETRGVAFALDSIGRLYSAMGQKDKALPEELAGLALAKTAGDPNIEGGIETALMMDFRDLGRINEAILFGTDAVNSYQKIRQDITGLDQDLQIGFAQLKSYTYRELAELLVQQDRLGEAEHVLDLLKEEELNEVVRGAEEAAGAKVAPVALTATEQKAQEDLATPEKTAMAVADLSAQFAMLQAKTARTPQEDAQLKSIETKIEAGNSEVSDFFRKTLYPELQQRAGTQNANTLLSAERSDVSQLQNTMMDLGPHVMGIRLLLGEQKAYAIIITPQARKKFELASSPADLKRKVLQVRDDVRNPKSDPKPHLKELYDMVVSPFAGELAALEKSPLDKGRVPTLLWSLDGAMRYLPMSALYDGQHYLAERFNNILFTPESYGHMSASSASDKTGLRVLAMGLSKSYGGLPALPGVLPELDAVVHDPAAPDSHGPMDGVLLPNEKFTYAALKTELGSGTTFPVVHIASHFVQTYGSGDEPFLMLGGGDAGQADGYQLTLGQLEDSTITFHGTHLLTLSACSTARGSTAEDGQEMDSLGMVAQQKDAEAVMATLWDVNDASTSRIMSDFYTRWVKDPAAGKAEALRQAQLVLLHGVTAAAPAAGGNYAHPFYWAPFVLIGNFQ